jgi:hypothetical protein
MDILGFSCIWTYIHETSGAHSFLIHGLVNMNGFPRTNTLSVIAQYK